MSVRSQIFFSTFTIVIFVFSSFFKRKINLIKDTFVDGESKSLSKNNFDSVAALVMPVLTEKGRSFLFFLVVQALIDLQKRLDSSVVWLTAPAKGSRPWNTSLKLGWERIICISITVKMEPS